MLAVPRVNPACAAFVRSLLGVCDLHEEAVGVYRGLL